MTDAAIQIENLTKDYPFGFLHLKTKRSLEGLTMSVEDGEVFGFLGPNGAGKSTTIKLLVGLIFPTAGTARILGKPISDIAMHQRIGYLPEQPYFYDYLTAAELLDYFARFHDLKAADRRERVQRMLKKVGLGDSAENPAAQIFEGHVAAGGPGAGDLARSASGDSGRADVRAGSAGAAGSARHHSGIEARRQDGSFFDAHFVRCGNVVRPRWRDCRREAAWRRCAGRDRGD